MADRKKYWNISATDVYINQVSSLGVQVQAHIQDAVKELAFHEDPREVGSTDDCGSDEEDCGIVVILPGLPFEITYQLYPQEEKILLIDCFPLDIFHSLQPE